ncbi:MAG TPA: S41 family peptidase [Candidatus Saccharimonadales bacterium]|nr:S41 family peptidase [Candidatus Saccharimonadales bacterium]
MHPDSAKRTGAASPSRKKIVKNLALVGIAVVVFVSGLLIGNGTIGVQSAANRSAGPEDLDYTSVEQMYDVLRSGYDGTLDQEKLLDGMKAGLANATGDPYTDYFSPKEAKEFNEQLTGSFTGIGAELGEDEQGNVQVVAPIAGFPADKAGLRPKDIIVAVDGKTTSDMSVNEVVKLIRGEKDTKVTLRILRNNSEDVSLTITREEIKIPSVKWEILEGNVGYLQISQFGEDTVNLTQTAAQEFVEKNVAGVVLDLRGDPGGLLDAAVEVSSLWLPKGKTILTQKTGGVTTETYTSRGGDTLSGIKTAVLIDAGSASASEIVAGALRDNKAATLYGEKSYGKGSVQQIHNLANGGEVKVTIARWYRPNGQNIDKKGIKPDKEIKMSDQDYEQKRDPQKDAAVKFIKSQ